MVRIPRKKVGRGNTSVADKKSHLHTEKVQASVFVTFNDPFPLFLKRKKILEMPGIEPGAFHMQSERATTALHPLLNIAFLEVSL